MTDKITKQILLLLFIAGFTIDAMSQKSTKMTYNGIVYYCYKVKVDTSSVGKFSIFENSNGPSHSTYLSNIRTSNDDMFLCTASTVNEEGQPLGLYINDYKLINDINTADGVGNFYLKPNGVLFTTNQDIDICETSKFTHSSEVKFAIQSGPMLIDVGVINSHFNAHSQNKHIRCGVGISYNSSNDKFIHFCISNEPVSLYDFSDFFLNRINCRNALLLESIRCVMSIPYLYNDSDKSDKTMYRYIIFDY